MKIRALHLWTLTNLKPSTDYCVFANFHLIIGSDIVKHASAMGFYHLTTDPGKTNGDRLQLCNVTCGRCSLLNIVIVTNVCKIIFQKLAALSCANASHCLGFK